MTHDDDAIETRPGRLTIHIDDEEAIANLKKLLDQKVYDAVESDPQTGLGALGIDFPNAPSRVKLPDLPTIRAYIADLEKEKARGAEGKYSKLAHGIILLYVAHGNGLPGPPSAV
jgi:hypothetical protein